MSATSSIQCTFSSPLLIDTDFNFLTRSLTANGIAAMCQPIEPISVTHPKPARDVLLSVPDQTPHLGGREARMRRAGVAFDDISKRPYEKALLAASADGHEQLVEILVNLDVDIDASSGVYGTALTEASHAGHEGVVKILLAHNADANKIGSQHGCISPTRPLHKAAEEGYEDILRLLIDHGARMNAQAGPYGTALSAASQFGHEGIVKLLLSRGADADAVSHGQFVDALHAAIVNLGYETLDKARRRKNIIEQLIEAGTKTDRQEDFHGGLIQAAVHNWDSEIFHFLLRHGFDPNATGGTDGSALHAAAAKGRKDIVQHLLRIGVDVNIRNEKNETPLHCACRNGKEATVTLLLDSGAEINAVGGDSGSPLSAAARGNHLDILVILLNRGANVNAGGGRCGNALQAAMGSGNEQIVHILLAYGPDLRAQGGYYGTVLQAASAAPPFRAIMQTHLWGLPDPKGNGLDELPTKAEVLIYLLEKDVDVNTYSGYYGTALYAAASTENLAGVKLLLNAGADINAPGKEPGRETNSTTLIVAAQRGNLELVSLLLKHGVHLTLSYPGSEHSGALSAAAAGGYADVLEVLLTAGANANGDSGFYGPVLQVAAIAYKGAKAVQKLLAHGADVNALGGFFGHALVAASYWGNLNTVKILLDAGVDPNAQGGPYGPALNAAAEAGAVKIVELLIDRGANVNAAGGYYGYATKAALARGHQNVLQLLYRRGAKEVFYQGRDAQWWPELPRDGHLKELLTVTKMEYNPDWLFAA